MENADYGVIIMWTCFRKTYFEYVNAFPFTLTSEIYLLSGGMGSIIILYRIPKPTGTHTHTYM